uniref:Thiamine pyrophosphate enzyme TPP-binding domain-containing protein n=1 Tax=Nymphaea colorata TaxID=210225 RepID=A0A5K1FAV7_9MAGN|nr:unnamed protein product [Nymphaea colorata]
MLDESTKGEVIIWNRAASNLAAQWYNYKRPRQWLTSGGLGAVKFGVPAAIGAAVANLGALVVDIDMDGSFIMNVQ